MQPVIEYLPRTHSPLMADYLPGGCIRLQSAVSQQMSRNGPVLLPPLAHLTVINDQP